jgi:hypothetical protein
LNPDSFETWLKGSESEAWELVRQCPAEVLRMTAPVSSE